MNGLHTNPTQTSMPMWAIMSDAVLQVWRRRTYFAKLILPPMVVTAVVGYIQGLWFRPTSEQPIIRTLSESILWAIPDTIILALLAIAVHRSILLGEHTSPGRRYLHWSRRESLFLGWSLLMGGGWLLMFAIGIALSAIVAMTSGVWLYGLFRELSKASSWITEDLGFFVLMVVCGTLIGFLVTYFVGRASLVLPATALEHRKSLKWAWTVSEPHDIRLAFLIGVIPLVSWALQTLIFSRLSHLLWPPLYHVLSAFVYCSLLVIEIAILSVCYRWITELPPANQTSSAAEPTN